MAEKKTIEEILNEGFSEYGEIGFGNKFVIYVKDNEQILYNEKEGYIILREKYNKQVSVLK